MPRIGSGTETVFATSDGGVWYLPAVNTVAASGDGFDFASFDNNVLLVAGALTGGANGISMSGAPQRATVFVQAGGQVSGGQAGVALQGSDHILSNAGSITGASIGIDSDAADSLIVNTGSITGRVAGVALWANGSVLINQGEISATAGTGLLVGGSGNLILNEASAVLQGSAVAVQFDSAAADNNVLQNKGVIANTAGGAAIVGGDGAEVISNTGTILGDVHLGGGDDVFLSAYTTSGGTQLAGDVAGTIAAGSGNDFVIGGMGSNTILGEDGNDVLFGHAADDEIEGGGGQDFLAGQSGNDSLSGGGDRDIIQGGDGADEITGGAEADLLAGGAGADRFIYTTIADSGLGAGDRISDFESGVDVLDLDALLAGTFTFIGAAAFDGSGPAVRALTPGESTVVQIDVSGNGVADMEIWLLGATLDAGDLIL